MSARLPTLRKSPFLIDTRPLHEMGSPHAGLLGVSRAFRSLGIPGMVEANVKVKRRQRGFEEGQMTEALVLLNAAGGQGYSDIDVLADDPCLERGLGYSLPRQSALRGFCESFHSEQNERQAQQEQLAVIGEQSEALEGMARVLQGTVSSGARRYQEQEREQTIATVDMDATIIESHKREARRHYKGGRGYQPLLAVWAEADLVVADEFRDGNVPANMKPLNVAQRAFAALPTSVKERAFRGDTACYEQSLLKWLNAEARAEEPGGPILFAVSAAMGPKLRKHCEAIPARNWETIDVEADGTVKQCAEVAYVPGQKAERKDSRPLRYIALRFLPAQGQFLSDGSDRRYFAIATNREEPPEKVIRWHREKAGTIEHVHEELKNGLAAGRMPSGKFGANALWFRVALIAYNVISLIRALALGEDLQKAQLKRLRLHFIHVAGRMSRYGCKLRLRFRASERTIARFVQLWDVFPLPCQPSATS